MQLALEQVRPNPPNLIVSGKEQEDWIAFLSQCGIEERILAKLDECGREFWSEGCQKHGNWKRNFNRCNDRAHCPRCAYLYARAKAYEIYEFLRRNIANNVRFSLYVQHVTLTLPHELDGTEDKKLVRVVRRLLATYQERGELAAYVYRVQNESSKDPLSPHKHVHIVLLNASLGLSVNPTLLPGERPRSSFRIKRRRPYFEVDEFRARFKKEVEREYKFDYGGRQADVFLQYAPFADKDRVMHWLTYLYRFTCWDVFKEAIREGRKDEFVSILKGVAGRSPVYVQSLQFDAILRRTTRATWVGYLSSRRYYYLGFFAKKPLRLSWLREEIRDRAQHCKICGDKLVRIYGDPPSVIQAGPTIPSQFLGQTIDATTSLDAIQPQKRSSGCASKPAFPHAQGF